MTSAPEALRAELEKNELIVAPGVYDALTARLVESAGFRAAFVSGAAVSFSLLGRPDVGLVSLKEMADRVAAIASSVSIPLIVDGDNGHGNAINTMRTVQLFEQAGAAAIQLEDQALPKKCGHMAGKRLVAAAEMVGKIRAAREARRNPEFAIIARTDARSVLGFDAALERAQMYCEAGADLIFFEAQESHDELVRVPQAMPGVKLVVNMNEGGKTPLVSAKALAEMGYAVALYPSSLTTAFVARGQALLETLKRTGSTESEREQMISFSALNELLGIDEIARLEDAYVVPTPVESITR